MLQEERELEAMEKQVEELTAEKQAQARRFLLRRWMRARDPHRQQASGQLKIFETPTSQKL